MKSLFKTIGTLCAFLLFLSIRIDSSTIFDSVYEVISPITISMQETTESFLKRSVSNTKNYSQKIFDNSVPKVKDSVKSKFSAHQKNNSNFIEEKISDEDKEKLDDLIKNH